jgi:hypothetical protein
MYPMRSAVMAHLQCWAGPALRLLRSPARATAAGSKSTRGRTQVEHAGDAIRTSSATIPLWYAVQMMHQPWLGLDPGASVWVFTGTAVISGTFALLFFRWE